MYKLNIAHLCKDNESRFKEILVWLNENISPVVTEERPQSYTENSASIRNFTLTGEGWRYEYSAITISVDNDKTYSRKEFSERNSNIPGMIVYVSKVLTIEDAYKAIEFRLTW